MIEWRWNLTPMTARDANARNLAETLNFSGRAQPVTIPDLPAFSPQTCPPSTNTGHAQP